MTAMKPRKRLPNDQLVVMQVWERESLNGHLVYLRDFTQIAKVVYDTQDPDGAQVEQIKKTVRQLSKKKYLVRRKRYCEYHGFFLDWAYEPVIMKGFEYVLDSRAGRLRKEN